MFVAPLPVPSAAPQTVAPSRVRTGRVSRSPLRLLVGWLVAGLCLLALVPAVRGGALSGATLPYWLVAAPAIDIVWLARARIAALARRVLRAIRRRRPQARRIQSRVRADRSSR